MCPMEDLLLCNPIVSIRLGWAPLGFLFGVAEEGGHGVEAVDLEGDGGRR